jgi:hypothetical protein
LIEFIESKNYDINGYNLMKQLVQDFGIADNFSIEGDFTEGYSIWIIKSGVKINLADAEISVQGLISTILITIMNGKFDQHFSAKVNKMQYTPDYYPIIIENPEYNLTEEHQRKFVEIISYLTKVLNTQIVIETQSKIITDRFKELGNGGVLDLKVYYFKKNSGNIIDSPEVMEFDSNSHIK